MKLLAIDTATDRLSVALLRAGRLFSAATYNEGKVHAERLLPAVDEAVRAAGWSPRDLQAVAVSCGPGSFTGLRIGVATAKALAFSLGIPACGVPTLEALALAALLEGTPADATHVAAALDARRGDVYAALYDAADLRAAGGGPPLALLGPSAMPVAEWLAKLGGLPATARVLLAGDAGAVPTGEAEAALGGRLGGRFAAAGPGAGAVGAAGYRRLVAAAPGGCDPHRLEIIYLRRAGGP